MCTHVSAPLVCLQAAGAAALSLLAARDMVIQDSCRYLGAIDHLVEMMASGDTYTAETARYCLLALRHANTKNQAEVIAAIRANSRLVRDVRRLDLAADLLRFDESTPRARGSGGYYAPATPPAKSARVGPRTPDRCVQV